MGPGPRTLLLVSLAAGLVIQSCAGVECPSLWTQYGGNCYRLFGELVNWSVASSKCRSLGSELASVHSHGENVFIYNLWRSATDTSCLHLGYWLGLSDIGREGRFVYTDGSNVDFTNWRPGQPDNARSAEDCGHVWYQNPTSDNTIGWNDRRCGGAGPYICKMSPP